MDTKDILGYLRSFEDNALYKHQLALKAMDELDRMIPRFNIDDIQDEELDEKSLQLKKRCKEMQEIWRKGGTVKLGMRNTTDPKEVGKTLKADRVKESDGVETKQSVREITWEEEKQCFKNAVLYLMKWEKRKGGYLFERHSHWKSVYRFVVDIGIMYDKDDPNEPQNLSTPQYSIFADFAKELQLDVSPPTRLPFKYRYIEDLNKKNYICYNKHHSLWSKEGLKNKKSLQLYEELDAVYKALEKEFNYFTCLAHNLNPK